MSAVALALRIGPWAIIAVLSLLLQRSCASADHAEMQAKVDVGAAQLSAAKAEIASGKTTLAAVSTYADRTAALQPLIIRSTDTVTRYAETAAGRALCLAPDRVFRLDQLDHDLFPAAAQAAAEGLEAVRSDEGAATGGRISK